MRKMNVLSKMLLICALGGMPQMGRGQQIAFVSTRDENYEIYVMNGDGTDQTNLTNHSSADIHPCWSPDGRQIAFVSDRRGNYSIFVMETDGSNPLQLMKQPGDHITPAWSPDGRQIAFASNQQGRYSIYVMEADGSNPIQLTDGAGDDVSPAWSPDGRQIAYSSSRDRLNPSPMAVNSPASPYFIPGDLFVMDADGSDSINLTRAADTFFNLKPSWSPDGTKIVSYSGRAGISSPFTGNPAPGNHALYILELASGRQFNFTREQQHSRTINNSHPSWSPDGTRIAFASWTDQSSFEEIGVNYDIYVVNTDGSVLVRLTRNPGYDVTPVWSPLALSGTNVEATTWGAVKAFFKGK